MFVFNSATINEYNPALDIDEIKELLDKLKDEVFITRDDCERLFEHIEQSAHVLKYLILQYEIPSEQAFIKWYHSKTKQNIDNNNLYNLSTEECLGQLMQEGENSDK